MNIKELLYFTEIAESKSLSAASRKLGVSQPTLSAYLAGLEKNLGTRLFYSEKRKLLPTPAGQIYLKAAKEIIAVRNQTYFSIGNLTDRSEKTLIVGATPHRGATKIAQLYHLFTKRYPDVKLTTSESYMMNLKKNVMDEKVAFAFGGCTDDDSDAFDFYTFSKEEVVVGIPAFHPLAAQASSDPGVLSSISLDQLTDIPMISLAKGCAIRDLFDKRCKEEKLSPTLVLETNNNNVVFQMIRSGTGCGLLPISMMDPSAKEIAFFSLAPKMYLNLCVFAKKGKYLSEEERFLIYLAVTQDESGKPYTPYHNYNTKNIISYFESEAK